MVQAPGSRIGPQGSPPRQRLEVEACGRRWLLERRADLETLWDEMGEGDLDEDERLPYWVELWPSSLVLSSWLQEHQGQIRGRKCLDVGCGLGLTALVASNLGALVWAFDYELQALEFARGNAVLNKVPQPLWLQMDWRAPALVAGSMDFVWGGDIMYELRFVEPVADLLLTALAPGGTAWVAEPDRNIRKPFEEHVMARGMSCERILTERFEFDGHPVTVNILELHKNG